MLSLSNVVRKRVGSCGKLKQGRVYLKSSWIGKEVVILDARDYEKLLATISNLNVLRNLLGSVLCSTSSGRKMFNIVSRTWNPVTGCLHFCRYCWARRLAETKLRNKRRYADGFKPRI